MNLNNLETQKKREDIFIGNKIDDENLLNNLSYKEFVMVCIAFTDKFVISRSKNSFLKEDLYFSNLFLKKIINQEKLKERRIEAWNRYDLLEGIDKAVQRITVCFLYPDIAEESNDGIDDFQELFLNLLLDVESGLCNKFFDFLISYLKN
ncbi:hypothetical protein [Neisseria animaloris]|uniref:Uncharacterized protein n=1 Tax=Neisseria animaloris TaxID=326522 RepID=A0A448UC91_9NEIS|nr:hypothetical protein [Neisseria animaloris]VEJ21501.1 Uncharacterised protein [Neisseria animaloris]